MRAWGIVLLVAAWTTMSAGAARASGSAAATFSAVVDSASGPSWSGTEQTGAGAQGEATVSGSAGTPTGTVTYVFSNGPVCQGVFQTNTVTISGGTVPRSSATAGLSAGGYSMRAQYSGDGVYAAATSRCLPFGVEKGDALSAPEVHDVASDLVWHDPEPVGRRATARFSVWNWNASLAPHGTVVLRLYGNASCSGNPLTTQEQPINPPSGPAFDPTPPLAFGEHSFEASYAGDSNFQASVTCQAFFVTEATPTITTVIDDPSRRALWTGSETTGARARFLTTLGVAPQVPPVGSVREVVYADAACSGSVVWEGGGWIGKNGVHDSGESARLPAGHLSVRASFLGDANYNAVIGPCQPFDVLAAPTATISSPGDGTIFTVNQTVPTRFSCAEGAAPAGPGLATCTDSHHDVAPTGHLDTARPGYHSYTVRAVSKDGGYGTATIHYAVVSPDNQASVTRVRTQPNGLVRFTLTVPGPGVVDVMETAWLDNFARASRLLAPAPRRFVFARLHHIASRAGTVQITVRPNARGRRLVRHHRYAVTIRLWVSYTPVNGRQRDIGLYGLHVTQPVHRH